MGCCLLVLIALGLPRLLLAILYFQNYLGTAYQSTIWPLLGFFFMPWTTAAYAYGMNNGGKFEGPTLLLLIIAVVFDVGFNSTIKFNKKKKKD